MFKLVRDGAFRTQATSYFKNLTRHEKRLLATKQEVVSWADVVIIGKFFLSFLFLTALVVISLLVNISFIQ